ncbi:MAG: LysM peptidoglycan-binding domain-containing protein [Treponema sp.]|jgi:hypothetical protein|nr:LysM peptidoglycan-binding domain-containing protein [Treponema sp.]
MNRCMGLVGALLLTIGVQAGFAQIELPEPVLQGIAPAAVECSPELFPESAGPELSFLPSPGLAFSEFQELVYLWSQDAGDGSMRLDFSPILTLAAAASSDVSAPVVPLSVRNNQYYLESVRLTKLAQESFDYGDYDASSQYAEEAQRYAQLSDEYVALQLKIKETNDAIAAARNRLDWAISVKAADRYPNEMKTAQAAYDEALSDRAAKEWDPAIEAARRVISALAYVREADAPPPPPPPAEGKPALPARYTVRPWAVSKDCFWNIAGRAWAYGDSTKWRIIYNANKAKMPDPDNPDLIHAGMVLDIPSVQGETRQGMWDSSKTYDPLR